MALPVLTADPGEGQGPSRVGMRALEGTSGILCLSWCFWLKVSLGNLREKQSRGSLCADAARGFLAGGVCSCGIAGTPS